MKDIKNFILEAKTFNGTFEDWIKSLKLKYTKEIRKSSEMECPLGDDCDEWEEYILDDFDTITSFAYCPKSNEFVLCVDSLFVNIEDGDLTDEIEYSSSFPKDIKLYTKKEIEETVKYYEEDN